MHLPLLAVLLTISAPHRAPDPASKIDFTVSGGGHQSEHVQIRDVYPEITAPYACFFASGIMFGVTDPVLELRAGKLGPKLWAIHFVLVRSAGDAGMRVTSPQPALVFNGDNSPQQQSWFPMIILPPLKQGTLSATLTATTPGRVRGTFAGTLVDDKGNLVSITNGTFDLPRHPDMQ